MIWQGNRESSPMSVLPAPSSATLGTPSPIGAGARRAPVGAGAHTGANAGVDRLTTAERHGRHPRLIAGEARSKLAPTKSRSSDFFVRLTGTAISGEDAIEGRGAANCCEIAKLPTVELLGFLDGQTTNPSLIAKNSEGAIGRLRNQGQHDAVFLAGSGRRCLRRRQGAGLCVVVCRPP